MIVEDNTLLTARQAADILQIRAQTLACWRMTGKYLPFIRVGRSVRYRRGDVEAFIASRTVGAVE